VNPIYLGVDVAGAKNTWVTALAQDGNGLAVVHSPRLATLEAIVGYCEENDVVAVAIDAQLTASLSKENGFRASDIELREMLHQRHASRTFVAAAMSLMAVPVQGRLLADHLSPTVGTLIETHPRASLLFGLGEQALEAVQGYKGSSDKAVRAAYTEELWHHWSERFGIAYREPVRDDGALDSIICATVAHQFHHAPEELHRLPHDTCRKVGRGPFYVIDPERGGQDGRSQEI
jgi:predicted nuclease with RNAse H fold